jgi:hypothetical protein
LCFIQSNGVALDKTQLSDAFLEAFIICGFAKTPDFVDVLLESFDRPHKISDQEYIPREPAKLHKKGGINYV